jgi:hypothetical protein
VYLASYLQTFSFFKRFSKQLLLELVKNDEIEVIQLVKDQVLPVSLRETTDVHVVINGKFVLREHNMNDPFDFNVI